VGNSSLRVFQGALIKVWFVAGAWLDVGSWKKKKTIAKFV